MTTARITALFCLMLSLATVAWAEEDFEVKLFRPVKVGQTYTVNGAMTTSDVVTVYAGGKNLQTTTNTVDATVVGKVEVMAVDDEGQAMTIELTIETFTMGADGAKQAEVLPKGSVIHGDRSTGALQFKVTGRKLDAKAIAILTEVLSGISEPNDDTTFGSRERRKVGESWSMNKDDAITELAKGGLEVAMEDLTGKTTLEGVLPANGVRSLRLKHEFAVSRAKVDIPPGVTLDSMTLQWVATKVVPVDVNAPVMGYKTDLTVVVAMKQAGADGAPDTIIKATSKELCQVRFTHPKQ